MNKYTEEQLIEAFHLMWDNYPESVRLNAIIQKLKEGQA